MDKAKPLASANQLREFQESLIWKDFSNELNSWKAEMSNEILSIVSNAFDNESTPNVLMHLGDIHGRIKAIDYFLALPDTLASIVENWT